MNPACIDRSAQITVSGLNFILLFGKIVVILMKNKNNELPKKNRICY